MFGISGAATESKLLETLRLSATAEALKESMRYLIDIGYMNMINGSDSSPPNKKVFIKGQSKS